MHHIALGCLADQLIHRGLDLDSGFLYDLALDRRRQRNAQMLLQTFEAIPGESAAVAQQSNHACRRLVILLLTCALWDCCRKHIPGACC